MKEDIQQLNKPYKLFLSESYGPVYESIIKNISLPERTSLRVVDKTIGDLVTRKYKFILSCIEKYEDYIRNHKLTVENHNDWNNVTDSRYHVGEQYTVYYPSEDELRIQLVEPHFSWMTFLYCLNTMNLTEEQLDELASVFLHDKFTKIKVRLEDTLFLLDNGESYTRLEYIYQRFSPKYLVCKIMIEENIDNLDNINEYLFNILVKDLTTYELEVLAVLIMDLQFDRTGFDSEDNSYVFQYLKTILNLPPPSEERYFSFFREDISQMFEDENGAEHEVGSEYLDYMLTNVYIIWMNKENMSVGLKYN